MVHQHAAFYLVALWLQGSLGQSDAPSEQSPPYTILMTQNLVLMGSIFSVLLIVMIIIAVCVYKPARRR